LAQGYYMGRPMPVDEFLQWSAAAAALRVTRAGDSAVLH
jgi:sensor c-di-GMP phosphodiesterase-like protein